MRYDEIMNYGEFKRYESRRKKERGYFIKQKLCGLAMIVIGIAIPILLDGDATVSLFAVPLGLYLIFTRNKVMTI